MSEYRIRDTNRDVTDYDDREDYISLGIHDIKKLKVKRQKLKSGVNTIRISLITGEGRVSIVLFSDSVIEL